MQKKVRYIFLRIIIIAIFSCKLSVGHAQQDLETKLSWIDGWTIGSSFHTGKMLNHHSYMSLLVERSAWLAELYMAKRANGNLPWHSFFGYPDYGFKLTVVDFGSPTYIGKAYSLHPFMKFYLINRNCRFTPSITASAGPAYVEKIFDRHDNYKNTAIGSHMNAFLQLQFDLNIRISNNIHAFTGFSFSHFSNGSFKKPNAGANIITAKIGAGYAFGETVKQPHGKMRRDAKEGEERKWSYRTILSGGLKRIDIGDSQYGVLGMSFEASRKHLAYTRANGSFDVFYDGSDYHAIHNQVFYDGDISRLQTVKVGLAVGYELLFNRVSANFQLGAYLYTKQKEGSATYQRFTIRYMATENIGVQFGLKSHMAAADYIELGCIYRIR